MLITYFIERKRKRSFYSHALKKWGYTGFGLSVGLYMPTIDYEVRNLYIHV